MPAGHEFQMRHNVDSPPKNDFAVNLGDFTEERWDTSNLKLRFTASCQILKGGPCGWVKAEKFTFVSGTTLSLFVGPIVMDEAVYVFGLDPELLGLAGAIA
jgi:hypothetical protein